MPGVGRVQLRRSPDARGGAQLLYGNRTGARHRGRRRPQRSADPRFSGKLPRAARHRRHARRPAPGGRPCSGSPVRGARRRAPRLDGGRTELRGVGRQPRRDGADRGGPAAGAGPPGRQRGAGAADRRHRARRLHRDRHGRPHRQLERTSRGDPRLVSRRGARTRHGDPGSASRLSRGPPARHGALSGLRRSPGREPPARAHRAAPGRTRVTDRDHHHLADAARPGILLRRVPERHLRAAGAGGAAARRQGFG